MVGKQDVEPKKHREADIEIEGDELLHPGAEHLHDDRTSIHNSSVNLAEARRGNGFSLKFLEDLIDRAAELLLDYGDEFVRRIGRGLVLKRTDRGQVGIGEDIGPGREELSQFDERGPPSRYPRHQLFSPTPVMTFRATRGAADDDPAPTVAQERQYERREDREDPNTAEEALHRMNEARPKSRRKPVRSVSAVRKTVEATAGSRPRRSRKVGM